MINNANEAVGVLVQAAEISTKAGVFSLGEVKIVLEAIEFLIPTYFKPQTEQPIEEAPVPEQNNEENKKVLEFNL